MQRELKDRYEEQEISSLLVGGEHFVDDWTIEYSLGISEASEAEPGRIDSEFEYEEVESAGYRGTADAPSLFYSEDGGDPSNFELKEIVVEDNGTKDEENALSHRPDARDDIRRLLRLYQVRRQISQSR